MATVSAATPNGHPQPPPQVQAELNDILAKDADKNRVAVHTFDPDATPEQKAAAAGSQKDKLKSGKDDIRTEATALTVDNGSADVVPTITVEDVDVEKTESSARPEVTTSSAEPQIPGAIPVAATPAIPEWYKVGWREVSGIESVIPEGETRDKAVLELFLNEQFYGDWYHNAFLIVTVVVITHFLTRFNFGWGWLFILLAFCNTYYSTSMSRVRRRARDDIQRELVKTRLDSDFESADWVNNFLDRFWLIYEPVLSQTIVASVDQVLSTNCPPFLDSLRLSTFTLGTKAPRIDKVKTSPRTQDDVVLMEWALSFTPNDTSEMTKKQKEAKVNPKIVLSVRLGKGVASAVMPILLEDISFSGLLRIRLKLMTTFPHIQLADLSFIEKPVIDYVLKPIGGDTFGFDVANIPGLSSFIRDMVHGTLGPMMYDPNVFTLNLEQLLSGEALDTAAGVLQVHVHSARGIKGVKLGGGTPDPFVSLSINNRAQLAKTKYKHSTTNPSWMETKFLLVNNLTETLVLSLLDYNDHRKNTELGNANFDLSKLREDASHEGVEAPVLKDGKERGMVRFDVSFYPVLMPEAGTLELPESKVGIVRLMLHQAKDLDHTKSMTGDLNPFMKVFLGNSRNALHSTGKVKHTNNPVWESAAEFLCTDRATSVITLKVVDDRDFMKDPVVGYMTVRLEDLLATSKEAGRDWWPLSGCKSGKVRLSVEWKPLNIPGALHGADQYVPPIGVVRLWLQKATDVKNVEAALGGKSDPYVRVQINNVTQGRTEVVNNNLNPEWDQIIYVPVHSLKEIMTLECMDYQYLTKDRSLGYVELKVSDLARSSEGGEYRHAPTGKKVAAEPIKLDKGGLKGNLHYEAEFIPALPVKDVKFETGVNEIQRASQRNGESDGDTVLDDAGSGRSSEEETVPEGITASGPLSPLSPAFKIVNENGTAKANGNGTAHKKTNSNDTAISAESADTTPTTDVAKAEGKREDEGLELSKDELLKHQSGVIIFNVISGHLQKKARLEVLLDDAYWPAFSTVRAHAHNVHWEYIGEGVIKELDFGRVWLRLNEADEGDKDDVYAEYKGEAKTFLKQTLDCPSTFTLLHKDDPEKTSTIEIETRYVPVPMTLQPRESINNQGSLSVELFDGRDIPAVDRGGKSDPFVVFSLNGQRIYKSQTKKKTLTPEWNERFEVAVPSRVAGNFMLEVFDWNQIEQAKSLGLGKIQLDDLEPFEVAERVIPLSSPKHGEKGSIRVSLLFRPEIIVKTRKNTSTFSTAGRTMTQIGHLPVGAGKGVMSSVTGVFKRDFVKTNGSVDSDLEKPPVPELPAGQSSRPAGGLAAPASVGTAAAAFPHITAAGESAPGHAQEPGTLRVMVLDAKDLSPGDAKPYVQIRVGDRQYKTKHASKTAMPEWNESFTFAAAPAVQTKMYAWVYDHKTLGKDKELGSAEIDLWRHLQPGSGVSTADVFAELREGQGLLRLRLEFDPDASGNLPSSRSRSSFQSMDRTISAPTSPSRFSLSGRRKADRDD
ncbi:Uncharacterized protein SCP_0113110 [Sparassis crispa]|uniref:Tricalbin n=1 Tax=Sparassis crispa TaxID=139825 RepID=A0A401G8G3_9APHY|nr:Uncharacterized protein SCP_0113110 [Sparassis crispa]GBE78423.1 Uncharacterized protein SCP_0113110 [Sparassis crispa]